MTRNGRDNRRGGGKRAKPRQNAARPGQAPSGVFRTANEGEAWGQRLWRDGWMVAEQFIRDGFYYRLLRRPNATSGERPRLTRREEDVLQLARAGHSNKSIAQVLNVSASTVGVLLFRAAAKLNVASRRELLAAYDKHVRTASGGEPPSSRGTK
jgi:DNA-binding CsgD family transcriptional regulator